MCQSEKDCRAENSGYHVPACPILKCTLNETAVNELFTHGHSDDQCKKYQAFNSVPRKEF
jgi:hypothetical protein